MSVNKVRKYDDKQLASLLDNEEAMDIRTHSGPDQEITNMEKDNNQQNDEGENGTNTIHDGTDGGKNQMMSVILISIMLVLVALTFSQSLSPFIIPKYDNPSPTSQQILIVYMLVGFLIIVAMFLRKHVITDKPTGVIIHGARDKIKYILRDYLSIVGMAFFFPFACILDLSHIITAASCNEIWKLCGVKFYSDYLVDLIYHLIHILFMGAELAFCCKFHENRFKENGLVRCGLMIVIAANIGLWFLSLVYDATERHGHPEDHSRKCSNESGHMQSHKNWQACVGKTSSAHKVMKVMIRYLYPFAIEFSLLAGEFLVTKFVCSTQRKAGDPERSPTIGGNVDFAQQLEIPGSDLDVAQQPQTPEGNVVGAQQPSTSGHHDLDRSIPVSESGHPRSRLGQLLSVFIIGIGLLASFLNISLAFIDSSAKGNGTEIDSLKWGYVYETYSMINYMLINVLTVVGYACSYGFQIQEKKLNGLDWLVLISAFGPFIYELIIATALAVSYTDLSPGDFPGRPIRILSGTANLVQLILQAPFIFLSERWRLTERQRSQPRYVCQEKILKAIIFCLAMTNLMNWIIDSIILTTSLSIKDELMKRTFKIDNWNIMSHLSLPLAIFYRFNSFLLFTRAYLGD